MTDWRNMAAGHDMDRLIAERLGWRVQKNRDGYTYLFRPDGSGVGNYIDAAQAWEGIPHFSTDLNAAFRLPVGEYTHLSCRTPLNDLGYAAFVAYDDHTTSNDYRSAAAATPALAVCRAWLAWQERGKE